MDSLTFCHFNGNRKFSSCWFFINAWPNYSKMAWSKSVINSSNKVFTQTLQFGKCIFQSWSSLNLPLPMSCLTQRVLGSIQFSFTSCAKSGCKFWVRTSNSVTFCSVLKTVSFFFVFLFLESKVSGNNNTLNKMYK